MFGSTGLLPAVLVAIKVLFLLIANALCHKRRGGYIG